MVGWSSWFDYLLSPLVNIILAVIYLEALFPAVNHWVWVIGLTALMTGVNLLAQKLWPILTAGLFLYSWLSLQSLFFNLQCSVSRSKCRWHH